MSTDMPQTRGIQLHEQGWTRRFIALGRRLHEVTELYRQLGFEILLEPVDLDEVESFATEGCKHCIVTTLARTIYTRPRRTVNTDERS